MVSTGFFDLIDENSANGDADIDIRTAKLTKITSGQEIPSFTKQVMELLNIGDEEVSGAIKYSLIELLRNVVQHSNSKIGGVAMAQYYPKNGLVNVSVADVGVGLRATLSEVYPEIDKDMKAVKFATQPHVSGTFGPSTYTAMKDNAGLGLFFIKQIASLSGGSFFLASGDAIVDIWGDASGIQKKIYKYAKNGGWPGTFAYLQLQVETIAAFEDVLHTCRSLAAQARKYPKELALDFIDDIPNIEGLRVVNVADFEEDVEMASKIRDDNILPAINSGIMVVINFEKVNFATQSFVHALMYKVIRDGQQIGATLSIANCSESTREAVMAVAAYAKMKNDE